MSNELNIQGNQNIVLQGVTDSTITVEVNGEATEIRNELAELRRLLTERQSSVFTVGRQQFNIEELSAEEFDFLTGRRAFNEWLTRRLIETLPPYSKPAGKLLKGAQQRSAQWEKQRSISDKAKDIIAYSYVGVLGIQLRKLFAIGKEEDSEAKQRRYLQHVVLTTYRALQLLNFALVSRLWDKQRDVSLNLSEGQQRALHAFFHDALERDLSGELKLLRLLHQVFESHQLEPPLSELKNFGAQLQEGSTFSQACEALQRSERRLDQRDFDKLSCYQAEQQLTTVLEQLVFLANYRMVSIKSIVYDEMRNQAPRYLHSYAALGIDSKFNLNAERVKYAEGPVNTDAILLYKGRYEESVNLFPFIIDVNALTFEGGAKVCFYSSKDIADASLNFRFLEDNQVENIVFQDTLKPGTDINELMMDPERRKRFKLDQVYLQFQEAQAALLGEAAPEDDFGDLMEGETDF